MRELTHTLQFPPAHAEIYGGPHAEWLRDCLEFLPRLQSLLVNGLPFFDHSSLLCLRHASLRLRSSYPHIYPVFGLRLLDASGCTNATSIGLAEALCHLPNLVSLNLSRTPAAKDAMVFSKLKFLASLRLLSLTGLGLKDADFDTIASSIGTRVRSLDVSRNHLTDASARALLDHCLKEEPVEVRTAWGPRLPIEVERADSDLDNFESENVVGHVRRKLTGAFVGSLAIERARDVGITHLYLSENAMTVEGISGLLRSKRLQVLDIGILPTVLQQPYSHGTGDPVDVVELPGVSKLTPLLYKYASAKLRYLRINHEVVTKDAPTEAASSPRAELAGDLGRYIPPHAHELEAIETPTPELDTTVTTIFEFPGDSSYPVEMPGSSPSTSRQGLTVSTQTPATRSQESLARLPEIEVMTQPYETKSGAANPPEAVLADSPHKADDHCQDSYSKPASGEGCILLSLNLLPDADGTRSRNRSRHNSIHYVEDRRARLELRQSQENRLHPNMLPGVHTLVLTDVPTSTDNTEVVHRLIQYIKDAAEEASIARQRAQHTYALPPGRCRAIAEREHAHSIFALERIVLEMAPPQATVKKVSTSWRAYPTKSSTEDADSEAFWDAATQDFSFFGDEECGLPDVEPGRTLPLAAMSGLELAMDRPSAPPQPEVEFRSKLLLDVVNEIAKFRKERKAAYNNLVQMGDIHPNVEGCWSGEITVVRKARDQDSGELDCYGNRYESGWYYR